MFSMFSVVHINIMSVALRIIFVLITYKYLYIIRLLLPQ